MIYRRTVHGHQFTNPKGTLALQLLEHLERLPELDVDAVLTVVRRVQGKAWGRRAPSKMRLDGRYLCFEMTDGSIFALDPRPEEIAQDVLGDPWPWVVVAADRSSWEAIITSPVSPIDWLEDCLCVRVSDPELARVA